MIRRQETAAPRNFPPLRPARWRYSGPWQKRCFRFE